jgi:hypothetical protein
MRMSAPKMCRNRAGKDKKSSDHAAHQASASGSDRRERTKATSATSLSASVFAAHVRILQLNLYNVLKGRVIIPSVSLQQ